MAADISATPPSKRRRASQPDAERSRSPTPDPPIASAPGLRASTLQKLYADAIAHVLKTCSHGNFTSCFPTPAREVPQAMKQLHEQFTEKLGDQLRKNFDGIAEERGVVRWLNELDRLVEEARRQKQKSEATSGGAPVPYVPPLLPPTVLLLSLSMCVCVCVRVEKIGVAKVGMTQEAERDICRPHTLPAVQLYLSYLGPMLATYSQQIRERHQHVEAEVHQRHERVRQQRQEIERAMHSLESRIGDLNTSIAALNPDGTDALKDEVRDVDSTLPTVP